MIDYLDREHGDLESHDLVGLAHRRLLCPYGGFDQLTEDPAGRSGRTLEA
jgi:hypothetical protein